MGGMWQPAGTQNSSEMADVWAIIASLNHQIAVLNTQVKTLNAVAIDVQKVLDRLTAPRYYPTEGTT